MYFCQKDLISSECAKISDNSTLRDILQNNSLVGSFPKSLSHEKLFNKWWHCHNFEESKAIQGPGTDMAVGENDYISSKDCM